MLFRNNLLRFNRSMGGGGSRSRLRNQSPRQYGPSYPPPDDPTPLEVEAGSDQIVSQGDTVAFNGSVVTAPNGVTLKYKWTFDDETNPTASSSGLTASYTYTTPGDKTPKLTVSYTDTNNEKVEASDTLEVKVIHIEPKTVNDGTENIKFEVLGATGATSFAWRSDAPDDAGNDPEVVFLPPNPTEPNTIIIKKAKWFAYPDQDCSDRIQDAADTSSVYKIFCDLIFPDPNFPSGKPFTATSTFTVDVPWALGGSGLSTGFVNVKFDGDPTFTQISVDPPLWEITGKGDLVRVVKKTINLPPSSQFYNKIDVHEQVHVEQLEAGGMASSFYTLDNFFNNYLKGLQHRDKDFLRVLSIPNALVNFTKAENRRLEAEAGLILRMEVEAYAASDQESPQYIYQNCNRFRLPDEADGQNSQ